MKDPIRYKAIVKGSHNWHFFAADQALPGSIMTRNENPQFHIASYFQSFKGRNQY